MRTHGRGHGAGIAHALDDARDVGGAVQLVHLLGHADVHVDERLVVGDHVLVLVGGGALQRVGRAPEEVLPQRRGDELQQGQDARGARGGAGGRAVQEEGEQAHAEGVALFVEPLGREGVSDWFWGEVEGGGESVWGSLWSVVGNVPPLEILDAGYALLRVSDHLAEEVGEAGATELGRPGAVEVSVIDGLAVGGGAETGGGERGFERGGGGGGGDRGLGALGCVHYGFRRCICYLG